MADVAERASPPVALRGGAAGESRPVVFLLGVLCGALPWMAGTACLVQQQRSASELQRQSSEGLVARSLELSQRTESLASDVQSLSIELEHQRALELTLH